MESSPVAVPQRVLLHGATLPPSHRGGREELGEVPGHRPEQRGRPHAFLQDPGPRDGQRPAGVGVVRPAQPGDPGLDSP